MDAADCGQTLDAVQEARAQVAAFPHQPDMLAIAELIEEEETLAVTASNNGFHPGQSVSSLSGNPSILLEFMHLKFHGTYSFSNDLDKWWQVV